MRNEISSIKIGSNVYAKFCVYEECDGDFDDKMVLVGPYFTTQLETLDDDIVSI